jgi:hypothetical protein
MFLEEHVIYRYKYLPFSKDSLKTLTEGTIKFTCPLDFNDPFDCLPHYDITHIAQVPRTRPDLFKAAGDRRGLSPAQRLQEKGVFVARLRKRIEEGSFAREMLGGVGVVSLSKNALNIPMWSHYADYHRGLVLEFRIPIMGTQDDYRLSLDRLLPFPIHYQANRPVIEIGKNYPQDLIDKLVLTKSLDWRYEEEERVIDHDRGPGIYKYRRDDILFSVIAGLKMKEENYHLLESLIMSLSKVTNQKLKLYRAREISGEYKLTVDDHPRLTRN